MTPIRHYGAKTRMGGSRRNINAESQDGPPKEDDDLPLLVPERTILASCTV